MSCSASPLVAKVCEMRRLGMTTRAIAAAVGLSPSTVYHYAWIGKATRPREEPEETSAESSTRIERELSTGVRCGHRLGMGVCCLLKPCDDHEVA